MDSNQSGSEWSGFDLTWRELLKLTAADGLSGSRFGRMGTTTIQPREGADGA